MNRKIITVDPEKCTGCRQCEIVCSVKHRGVSNPSRSPIQVIKRANDGLHVPVTCQHCVDAPCMSACPKEAIEQDTVLNRVVINQGLCVTCQRCVSVCPFGAVEFDEVTRTIFKCDLCGGDPECVHFCEAGAITYTEDVQTQAQQKRQAAARLLEATRKGF